jgi:AAA-like domain
MRQADLDLVSALGQGHLCYVFNARQMGKSSLRVRAMSHLQQQGQCCGAVDLTLLGTQSVTLEQWYASLVSVIAQSFDLKVDVPTWWRSHGDMSVLHRVMIFLKEILLHQCSGQVIIFVDEVDSTLSLPFPSDDFFGLIRAAYDRRTDDPDFRRLTWTLLGVATPNDLICDRYRSPFNVGQAIPLQGFQEHEVLPLSQGLVPFVSQPMAVLRSILQWSGGQPFLTQKLCQLVVQTSQATIQGRLTLPPGMESFWIDNLVQTYILQDWEAQDNPEHLRSIRDRLLYAPNAQALLRLYGQILTDSSASVVADSLAVNPEPPIFDRASSYQSNPDLQQLLLSGLIDLQCNQVRVKNPIYQAVFNLTWIQQKLQSTASTIAAPLSVARIPPKSPIPPAPIDSEARPSQPESISELNWHRSSELQALKTQIQRLRRQRNVLLLLVSLILLWVVLEQT